MRMAEVVAGKAAGHGVAVVVPFRAESVDQPRKAAAAHSDGEIVPPDFQEYTQTGTYRTC